MNASGRTVLARDRWSLADRVVLTASLLLTGLVFLDAHHQDALRPRMMAEQNGFWWWADQSRYLQAAIAWVDGDLTPDHQHYPPGYSLLAAPFVPLGWPDPFLVPDLVCLLLSLVLFASITSALSPERSWAFCLGATIFTCLVLFSPLIRRSWVIPWTTTPTVPLVLGCMLLVIRFQVAATPRLAFLACLTMTAVAWFRPTETIILLATVPPFLTFASLRSGLARHEIGKIAVAAIAGAALPVCALLLLLAATHGFSPGGYLAMSAGIGFEWRLLPLRWVTIVISPQPLFPSGLGLAQVFRWVVPGFCGLIVAATGLLRGNLRGHLLVASVIAATMVVYLAYRDLHPQGLWKFNNYHYFKIIVSLLAIYASLLIAELVVSKRRLAIAVTACLAAVTLFSWRAEWRPDRAHPPPIVVGPHRLDIQAGLDGPTDALVIPADGPFNSIYSGQTDLRVGQADFHMNGDYKSVVVPGGMLVEPLRPIGPGSKTLTIDPGIDLHASPPPVLGRMIVVLGPPCWRRKARTCGPGAGVSGRASDGHRAQSGVVYRIKTSAAGRHNSDRRGEKIWTVSGTFARP